MLTVERIDDLSLTHLGNIGIDYENFARAIESAACAERDARIAELEQQLEEARKDAELYGQLKALAHKNSAYDIYGNGCLWTIGLHSADSSLSFDAAIRAAIKEQTK